MTRIDPQAEIDLSAINGQVRARVPLADKVTDEWIRCYERLARAAGAPARIDATNDRVWIAVSVSENSNGAEAAATMEAARGLIAAADAAAIRTNPAGQMQAIRAWWRQQQAAGRRQPVSGINVVRTGIGAEKRWTLAAALALAITILLLLPGRFSVGPTWVVPTAEGLLLIAILAADRYAPVHRSATVRVLSLLLVFVLVAEAAFVTGRLVTDLVEGGPETNSAADLLLVGSGVWIYTILAFAFLYWLLDGGGPEGRIWDPRHFPDLSFPQQLNPHVARPGWRPKFSDYLYVGLTNATAFSPTDVMPTARWAKLAMTAQAIGSLAVLGLVIARAVNIFR